MFCSFLPGSYASQGGISLQPEIAQILFNLAGLETEIVELDREDDFDRALYTEALWGDALLIGFPETGVARGVPFLLSVEGEEVLLALSEDGMIQVIDGNEEVVPASIIDAVDYLINTLVDLVRDILEYNLNIFNVFVLVFNAVFNILGCIVSIF